MVLLLLTTRVPSAPVISISTSTISTRTRVVSGHHHHSIPQLLFLRNKQPSLKYISSAAQKEEGVSNSVEEEEEEEEEEYQVLSAINSTYNDIIILDSPQSKMLLLDSTRNIHSIFMKGEQKWTASYWDEFASLPPIIPNGPIAIFGLGGGTAAHLMLTLWPSLHLHGWEIDQILIDKAREHLGLSHLEKHTETGGLLHVHIGDALSTSTTISGGYAGIVVDLFSGGEVLPQLQEVQTWLEFKDKLMPNGRLMVNCGGTTNVNGSTDTQNSFRENNSTLDILCKAFPGQVNWKKTPKSEGDNHLALTGPLPDLDMWAASLPHPLSSSVMQWTSCFPS